jgi:hypothetical protein
MWLRDDKEKARSSKCRCGRARRCPRGERQRRRRAAAQGAGEMGGMARVNYLGFLVSHSFFSFRLNRATIVFVLIHTHTHTLTPQHTT